MLVNNTVFMYSAGVGNMGMAVAWEYGKSLSMVSYSEWHTVELPPVHMQHSEVFSKRYIHARLMSEALQSIRLVLSLVTQALALSPISEGIEDSYGSLIETLQAKIPNVSDHVTTGLAYSQHQRLKAGRSQGLRGDRREEAQERVLAGPLAYASIGAPAAAKGWHTGSSRSAGYRPKQQQQGRQAVGLQVEPRPGGSGAMKGPGMQQMGQQAVAFRGETSVRRKHGGESRELEHEVEEEEEEEEDEELSVSAVWSMLEMLLQQLLSSSSSSKCRVLLLAVSHLEVLQLPQQLQQFFGCRGEARRPGCGGDCTDGLEEAERGLAGAAVVGGEDAETAVSAARGTAAGGGSQARKAAAAAGRGRGGAGEISGGWGRCGGGGAAGMELGKVLDVEAIAVEWTGAAGLQLAVKVAASAAAECCGGHIQEQLLQRSGCAASNAAAGTTADAGAGMAGGGAVEVGHGTGGGRGIAHPAAASAAAPPAPGAAAAVSHLLVPAPASDHAAGHITAGVGVTTPVVRHAVAAAAYDATAAEEPAAAAGDPYKQLNIAQQELAQPLFAGVKGWVQAVGKGLLRDPRTKLAQANPMAQQRQRPRLGKRGRGRQPDQPQQQERRVEEKGEEGGLGLKGGFYDVGRWAASGGVWRLEDLMNKTRAVANGIR